MQLTRRQALATAAGTIFATESLATKNGNGGHVVLLGDSIFDNKRYVGQQPAVIDQVRTALPAGWKATLLAGDGSVIADVKKQLTVLPQDATHLIISVGSNDALRQSGIFDRPARRGADVFLDLASIRARFDKNYRDMLEVVLTQKKPTVVCTIYDPNYPDAQKQMAVAGLAVFNDCITRAAFERGLPLLDLRILFTAKEDYANPIEPSPVGGEKIAVQIRKMIEGHDFTSGRSTVFPGR